MLIMIGFIKNLAYRYLRVFKTIFTTAPKDVGDIERLRKLVKSLEFEQAQKLAEQILARQDEPHPYALFAKGWAAHRLHNYPVAIEAMNVLLQDKEHPNYYTIRGNSHLKLGQLEEAVPDLKAAVRMNPDDLSSFKKLLHAQTQLGHDTFGFENQIQVQHNLQVAYRDRNWERFDLLLEKMQDFDTLAFRYWELLRALYYVEISDPSEAWHTLHEQCREQEHALSYSVFRYYIQSLVQAADLEKLKADLPKFKSLYDTHYPITNLPGACALFLKNNASVDGLAFLNEIQTSIKTDEEQARFALKAHPYLMLFDATIDETKSPNSISELLAQKMRSIYPKGSAADQVLDACETCWGHIRAAKPELLLDTRYETAQASSLRQKVLDAVAAKRPFSLLRVGDGECYAFARFVDPDAAEGIEGRLEDFWWGKPLTPELRQSVIDDFISTFKGADIIGFPYTIRLSQVLMVNDKPELSYPDNRLRIVFEGVSNLYKQQTALQSQLWTDEFCNYALMDRAFVQQLIELAPNVVIVTCFQIPEDNIFDHPKVTTVITPPARRVSTLDSTGSNEKILPELMRDLAVDMLDQVQPGTVVLVCAGYAGKFMLQAAKEKGAIAIDFGSSIDHLLGLKTRNLELHTLYAEH